ncbi:MAG: hypothetical protein EXS31_16700 [Pedosphaera sp.]|nr:hypothetical protein [Pedosphaera sp.]
MAVLGPGRAALVLSTASGIVGSIIVGDSAPGTSETFLELNQAAQAGSNVVLLATTSGTKQGIWSGTATNLHPVAFSGASLPASLLAEFGPGARWGNGFSFSGSLGMNSRRDVAFSASVWRGSDYLGSYLFAGPPEAPCVAARLVRSDSTQDGFIANDRMVMNAAGDLAFTGGHTSLREVPGIGGVPGLDVNGLGLTHQHGSPNLVLAEGKTAPGLKEGEVISFFGYGGRPFMNRYGQVLIHAEIGKAVGFEYRTDQGIWLIDPIRGPQMVARGGTQIDLGGGRIATIEPRSVRFASTHEGFRSGGEDGHPQALQRSWPDRVRRGLEKTQRCLRRRRFRRGRSADAGRAESGR